MRAREVLDSRGNPTVEAEVVVGQVTGRASVPSGASTGSHEALELRDGDLKRFRGKGVKKAVANVNEVLGPAVVGRKVADQEGLDRVMIELDGTPNKRRLGANAILSVSMAAARAAASLSGEPLFALLSKGGSRRLPVPMMNVLNGGEHADNDLAIQEFVIEPVGARTCSEAIRFGAEVYQSLKGVLSKRYGKGAVNVGDEGGFAPPMRRTGEALEALSDAVKAAGYGEGDVRMGIDAAASTFYDAKTSRYVIDGEELPADDLESLYASLRDEYALLTIEDPFQEGALEDFAAATKKLGGKTTIIGDDLYVTNAARISEGVKRGATNGVLIKLNQVGTVSETIEAIRVTQRAGWSVAVSHRSGETDDPFIAHLATAFGARFIKAGAPARGERVAKYNELLRIEEGLGRKAAFAGGQR